MTFTKWFIVLVAFGSLVFSGAKAPEQFSQVAVIALPLMTQTLKSKQNEGKDRDKDDKDNNE